MVPHKGMTGTPWIAKEVSKDLEVWGHTTCVFKADQETELKAVINEVTRLRAPLRTIPENSPKGDSQANGSVERANRSAKAQIRALLFSLEARLGAKVDMSHNVMVWLVQHAGYILSHYTMGRD